MRTISLYDTASSSVLSEISTTVSPATLIPHYDVDTKLLFLTGKVIYTVVIIQLIMLLFLRVTIAFLLVSM